MTVTGTDSIVKGEISRKADRAQSEGTKIHRGMSKLFIKRRIFILLF